MLGRARRVTACRQVVVPDLTMVATANAVVALGAAVVFADVEAATLCLSPRTVQPKLSNRTKAVVAVHLNNRASALPALQALLAARLPGQRIALVEDAAQSLGASLAGRHLGTWGDLGTLSFSSPKVISTGQGGCVLVPPGPAAVTVARALRRLKDFGRASSGADDYAEQVLRPSRSLLAHNFECKTVPTLLPVLGSLAWL
jgi:perosamine synthetase